MTVKFSNNASTTLATGINNSVTSVVVASATNFPSLSGSEFCFLTLQAGATIEIVKATALSGSTFTVVRAQGGTSASAFSAGAQVELRMNTALLQAIKDEGPKESVLKVDQSNNRVGILNTSPDVSLDVGSATDSIHIPVGTTAQRPGSAAAGYFRFNSTETQFEGYDGSEWGEIGGGGATKSVTNYSGDGSDTTFTLPSDPLTENNTDVFIDGVYQQKDTYSVSGTTLTFSEAPPNGSSVEVQIISASNISVGSPDDNTVSTVKIQNDAVTYDKIQNVSATDRLLGRDTAGAGSVEEIAPSAVRTMLSLDNAGVETAYNAQVAVATQAEAEAGTVTAVKRFTPERIKQAIKALSGVSLDTTVKTSAFTAVAGTQYLVNTTSSAITITLPASPSAGDMIGIIDYQGTFATNNVTLGRNGSNVFRAAEDGTIDTNNWSNSLKFIDATVGWLPVGD